MNVTMLESAIQFSILGFGALTIYLLSSSNKRTRFAGFIIGTIHQPFWFYATWTHHQWGMFALSAWYAVAYIRGLCNNRTHHPIQHTPVAEQPAKSTATQPHTPANPTYCPVCHSNATACWGPLLDLKIRCRCCGYIGKPD